MAPIRDIMKPQFRLNILTHEEDGMFVSHCLEMDIVATNTTEKKALNDVINLIKAQIIYAIENKNEDYLLKSAPLEVWRKIKEAKKCENRTIHINIPKDKATPTVNPMREVELCLA